MKMGSVLAFDVIFSLGLILILFIAAALVIHMVVPYLGSNVACIDGQKSHIKEINDTIEDVQLTGVIQIKNFKVESCVRCVWYNNTHMNFKWVGQGTTDSPQSFGVTVPWNNFGTIIDNDNTCNSGKVKGGQWCTLQITPNSVDVQSGCDSLT